jgi:hypothetical protein
MSEESIFKNEKNPFQEQTQEIIEAVREGNFNSAEFRIAYQMSLGLSEDETSYPDKVDDKVRGLSAKLADMSKDGLPLTSIAGILKEIEERESVPDTYFALVDALAISDREKKLLYSIVEKKRNGTLFVSDKKTLGEVARLKISEFPKDNYSACQAISELTAFLYLFKLAKIEISFIE